MATKLRTSIKKGFDIIRYSKIISYVSQHSPKLNIRRFLFFVCLVLVLTLAISIRVLPLKWGFSLSEFDPYYQYEVTRHIVENGLFSWSGWTINDMWFPQGRDVAGMSYPAFPMTGAVLYFIISSLGLRISVMDACIVFPIVFAVLTCIVAYYLGKEVGGSKVGLLSTFFLAVNPAYISRTTLGWYDDETVGIFGILLTSLLFLRALKQEKKWQVSFVYSIAAGASLGYVFASWGASRYLLALLAVFTVFLWITKMYSRRLFTSYGTLMAIGLSIAVLVPKLGFNFVREFESVAAIGVFLLLAVHELSKRVHESRRKKSEVLILAGLGVIGILLWQIGFISLPIAKFISVLNPFERINMPLVESVQEHRPATWTAFYYQFGPLVFLAPLGIIFALQKTNRDKIFILTYALTTLYFSASMIRLTVLMAPALCILSALAIVEIIKPFTDIITQRVFTRRRLRLYPTMGKPFSVLLIITLLALTSIPLGRGIDSAYSPTTIDSSSLPIRAKVSDWTETLMWMKENLPQQAVVASWWDYGYWITVIGDKITLADNGTFNATQIAWIGRMFMSTESDAITMIKDFNTYARTRYNSSYNISHIVVFTTLGLASSGQNLFGDEVKWRWMAKIGWNSTADKALEDLTINQQLANSWSQSTTDSTLLDWYDEFGTNSNWALPKADRVLTKLMVYGAFGIDAPEHFKLIFSSTYDLVFVYEVLS